jgi:hypothetical protein
LKTKKRNGITITGKHDNNLNDSQMDNKYNNESEYVTLELLEQESTPKPQKLKLKPIATNENNTNTNYNNHKKDIDVESGNFTSELERILVDSNKSNINKHKNSYHDVATSTTTLEKVVIDDESGSFISELKRMIKNSKNKKIVNCSSYRDVSTNTNVMKEVGDDDVSGGFTSELDKLIESSKLNINRGQYHDIGTNTTIIKPHNRNLHDNNIENPIIEDNSKFQDEIEKLIFKSEFNFNNELDKIKTSLDSKKTENSIKSEKNIGHVKNSKSKRMGTDKLRNNVKEYSSNTTSPEWTQSQECSCSCPSYDSFLVTRLQPHISKKIVNPVIENLPNKLSGDQSVLSQDENSMIRSLNDVCIDIQNYQITSKKVVMKNMGVTDDDANDLLSVVNSLNNLQIN